jgi:hypothetical protein
MSRPTAKRLSYWQETSDVNSSSKREVTAEFRTARLGSAGTRTFKGGTASETPSQDIPASPDAFFVRLMRVFRMSERRGSERGL